MVNQYLSLLSTKKISWAISLGFISLTSLLSVNSAHAFDVTFENTDFENDYASWTTIGDTSIQELFEGELQYASKQALISTGCPDTLTGRCFDQGDSSLPRNDDTISFTGTESSGSNQFNFSSNPQINADGSGYTGSFSTNLLQDFLGVDQNALHILRENGTLADGTSTRTPKEGSAIRQTITVDSPFTLSFNWSFLTNDDTDSLYGESDYSFLSLYDTTSGLTSRGIEVLADTGDVTQSSGTSFIDGTHTGGNGTADYNTYTSEILPAGTYVVGLGVVDVDGDERTSGLLVDRFVVQDVPFEFSPTLGLIFIGSIFGMKTIVKKVKK